MGIAPKARALWPPVQQCSGFSHFTLHNPLVQYLWYTYLFPELRSPPPFIFTSYSHCLLIFPVSTGCYQQYKCARKLCNIAHTEPRSEWSERHGCYQSFCLGFSAKAFQFCWKEGVSVQHKTSEKYSWGTVRSTNRFPAIAYWCGMPDVIKLKVQKTHVQGTLQPAILWP